MAEGRFGVANLGDRAAVALEAAAREHRWIERAATRGDPAGQVGVDRRVAQLGQIVTRRIAPQAVVMAVVAAALQVDVAHLVDRFAAAAPIRRKSSR